jgi:DNA-binding transcriptional MerR regulator
MRMKRMQDDMLSIGSFARESGLSHKALRLYAGLGLLAPAHVDRFTGYRYYGREQLRSARLIRLMREMEMPLSDIRRVLAAPPEEAERLIATHERAFIERLQHVRTLSRQLIQSMRQKEYTMNLQVEVKELLPQQVVSIEEHVLVNDLEHFILDGIKRLTDFVIAQGGNVIWPAFGIYHGPINHEDDGPIEVCVPAEGAFQATGDVRIREIPGGPAAVVTVRGEYCSFPKIIEAYDAAYDWIAGSGHKHVGPPREVWYGEADGDGPFEIVWRFE